MYDLIIIGGGPAGVAAGVYAARKKIKTALVAESFGGQSLVSADVQNWIGDVSLSGFDLAQKLEKHIRAYTDVLIISGDRAAEIKKIDGGFALTTKNGKMMEAKTIFVASGSRRRKLGVPGEDKFEGKGVAYCSICDAPIFAGKDVAVVGGGNAGLEAVVDLLPYATKIYLVEFSDSLKGDPVTQEKVKADPRVEIIFKSKTLEVRGADGFVTGLKYLDMATNATKELPVGGVFVEIGAIPNADFLGNLVEKNKFGEVIVDHKTQRSSLTGIWAAGDVSDVLYKQNNISAGDAVKAVLNIYDYLQKG
ncbi:FAD-dependent oxidoreductase [Candidatus Wolfebacteria bacterium]|nr:FAD-dependent oxidoreductase [Candidatus Wolfebacteria bacterium]